MIRLNTCEFYERKTTYQKILEETKVPSKVYKQINTNYNVIKNAHRKFCTHVLVDNDEFCEALQAIYIVSNNADLRSFQYKQLHSAIVLNMHLF